MFIGELEQFMMKHRKVTAFIKACKEQIDLLKNSTTNEEANTKGWHGIKGSDASNADAVAHKHGVVPLPPPSPPQLCSQTEDQLVSVALLLEERLPALFPVGWGQNDAASVTQKARDGDEDPEWLCCEVLKLSAWP
ncbi:hypothetical protein Tsubulata_014562 [Turnera subulata]|uniref:Uncharacterized protein n=1 Tax=Turnera subulata TaxID=218843 RepID=A0A9Q0FIZ5_9ROSI|nr:hypothetical protein Tsubulata_014562 [Turnera subulata]